jgi:hypothetical protein
VTSRLHTTAFGLLCVLGIVVAVALSVREITRTTPIALSVEHTSRTGLATLVSISVHNRTDRTRCLTVRVAARDRAGHDLAATTIAPPVALAPHGRRTVHAVLTLTAREYAEQLQAFYPSQRSCTGG